MVSVAVPLILRLARKGEVGEVDRLLDGDPRMLNARHGPTLTTVLSEASYHGSVGLVARLLERGAAVDVRNAWGRTALMDAAQGGHCAVVGQLVEHGADRELK
jgi:ankyrin repeat protein